VGYFEKPIDFPALIKAIESAVPNHSPERRAHLRIVMKWRLRLAARTENQHFQVRDSDHGNGENVSAGGFSLFLHDSITERTLLWRFICRGKKSGMRQGSRDPEGSFPAALRQNYGSSSLRRQKTGCSNSGQGAIKERFSNYSNLDSTAERE